MRQSEKFYIDGYTKLELENNSSFKTYIQTLTNIKIKNLKHGYYFKQKYPFSEDLRPRAFEYHSSIFDILLDNEIPKIMKNLLGYDLVLSHIQIRIAYAFPEQYKDKSYMEWHRDSYFYDNKITGNLPPVYKIIHYPNLGEDSVRSLAVSPGSHLRMTSNREADYDQLRNSKIDIIDSSDNELLFFNTSMFHSTLPAPKDGRLRVIYNFCIHEQLNKYQENKDLHTLYIKKGL